MRYFIHIVTETTLIPDIEGAEFPDLATAQAEAIESARELIAEELRWGRQVPTRWQAQVALADGTVLKSISFATLVDGGDRAATRQPGSTALRGSELQTAADLASGLHALHAQAKATADKSKAINEEIKALVGDIRDKLRKLRPSDLGMR